MKLKIGKLISDSCDRSEKEVMAWQSLKLIPENHR